MLGPRTILPHMAARQGKSNERVGGRRPPWRPRRFDDYADLIHACSNHDRDFVRDLAQAVTASVPQDVELLVLDILHESLLGGTISQMEISTGQSRWWIRRRLIARCGVSPQEMLIVLRGLACKWMQLVQARTCRQAAREVGVRDPRTVASSMRRISESMRTLGLEDCLVTRECLTQILRTQWERLSSARCTGPSHRRRG